jgi:hypothetical protein
MDGLVIMRVNCEVSGKAFQDHWSDDDDDDDDDEQWRKE